MTENWARSLELGILRPSSEWVLAFEAQAFEAQAFEVKSGWAQALQKVVLAGPGLIYIATEPLFTLKPGLRLINSWAWSRLRGVDKRAHLRAT